MPGPHRSRPLLLAALVLVAVAGLWHLGKSQSEVVRVPAGEVETRAPDDTERVGPYLVASGTPPAARGPVSPAVQPGAATDADPAEAKAATPGIALPGAVLGPLFAVAPGSLEDHIAADARAPIVLPRSYVVGRVGPYGVRTGLGASGFFDWDGVARLERESRAPPDADAEAEDDTEEPVTTAVRGVVLAEDGTPAAGAEVILYSSFYLRQAYYDHRVRQIGRVLTDADGQFDLRPIDLDTVHFGADGEVLVTVRHAQHPDIVAQVLSGIVPGRESDIGTLVLPARAARVHGTVRDLQGRPIEGAAVRASGAMNPVDYDKTERMVVLGTCPTAITDAEGRYDLTGFAGGVHEISIHVNIDCVVHVRGTWTGAREWSPRVQAGNGIRGRVVDPEGEPVAAAVVAGGANWTPTNADGTFWLDNVQAGPLTLEVTHHLWRTVRIPGVESNAEEEVVDLDLTLEERLPRVTLEVVDADEAPIPLVAIDWVWAKGKGPGLFAPDSRYWHDAGGEFHVVIPEGAAGAVVSNSEGTVKHALGPDDFVDGTRVRIKLTPP